MWFFKKSAPFTLGSEVQTISGDLVIKMYNGTRNSDSKEVSIFQLNPSSDISSILAQNLAKSWKTFRHPAIPIYIDSYDDGGKTHIVTEKIEPFKEEEFSDCELVWAVHTLSEFVSFLGESSNTIHGNLNESSLFQTSGHELKIAGLQWLTQNNQGPIRDHYNEWTRANPFNSVNIPQGSPVFAADTYYIANYIKKWANVMPKQILRFGHKWIKPAKNIPAPSELLELDFWQTDKFSQVLTGLKELALKDQSGREHFFTNLAESIDLFSVQMQIATILPVLSNALSYSPTPAILEPIFTIGEKMDTTEFANSVAPGLVELFTTKNPTVKVVLLSHISLFCSTIERATINEKIFPNVIAGLSDQLPSVRQTTIIAMAQMAGSLSRDNMAVLIRNLKNIQGQNDAQMRANTVICVVKIAEQLDPESRPNTLLHFFGKAAVDPFPPARRAAVAAYRNCSEYFDEKMLAAAVLPAIGPLCADPADDVRISALKLLRYITEVLCKADAAALEEVTAPHQKEEKKIEPKEKEKEKEKRKVERPKVSAEDAWDAPLSESEDERPKRVVRKANADEEPKKEVRRPINRMAKKPIRTIKKASNDADGWEDDDFDGDEFDDDVVVKGPSKTRAAKPAPGSVEVDDLIDLNPITPNQTTAVKPKQSIRTVRKIPAKQVKPAVVEEQNDGWDDFDDVEKVPKPKPKPEKQIKANPIRQTKPVVNSNTENLRQSTAPPVAVQPTRAAKEVEEEPKPEVRAAPAEAPKQVKVVANRPKVVRKLSKKGPKVVKIDNKDGWDDEDWEDI